MKISLKIINVFKVVGSIFCFLFSSGLSAQQSNLQNQEFQTFESYKDIGYDQTLRPQFHFTSLKNWINDPNGMVWYDGEYHLFFQHNPKGTAWGNMTWGHAVSTDMVHWKQLPHAILPYGGGTIYSGTAVIDNNNSLGKQKGNPKTMVAFFTYAKEPFYQSAAYSTDKGRTFQLLNNGEAVVPNQKIDRGERDPKLFWHEASKKWVMVLWVKKGDEKGSETEKLGKVRFFNSENLIDWKLVSELEREWVYECMDLVELPIDGNMNNKKWVLYDASFEYEIGEFNGKTFTSDKRAIKGDFGTNFYAAQSFYNSPDERTVMMGWMNGIWKEPTFFERAGMPFNLQMSFPTTMELRTTPKGIRLYRWPVKEIEKLYVKTYTFSNLSVNELSKKLASIKTDLLDLTLEFEPKDSMVLNIRGLEMVYDMKTASIVYGNRNIPAPITNGKVKLRALLDRVSLELFVNEGAAVGTFYALPESNSKLFSISVGGNTKINSMVVSELRSSWAKLSAFEVIGTK